MEIVGGSGNSGTGTVFTTIGCRPRIRVRIAIVWIDAGTVPPAPYPLPEYPGR